MARPAGRPAADDVAQVGAGDARRGVGEGVGRGVGVEQQGPPPGGEVLLRAVDGAAVVHRHRPRRPFEVAHLVGRDPRRVLVAETADPVVVPVVLVEQLALVAALDHGQRPLVRSHVGEVDADRQGAVVGVGPEGDVLVPLHLLAPLRPLEVELGVVVADVGAHQVGRQVDDRPPGGELPEQGVVVHRARHPPQARGLGRVPRLQVEDLVRDGDGAAALHHLVGGRPEPLHLVRRDVRLDQQVSVGEIRVALVLGDPHGGWQGGLGHGGSSCGCGCRCSDRWIWFRWEKGHMQIQGLRSSYDKVGEIVFFGRMLDKIRLHSRGSESSGRLQPRPRARRPVPPLSPGGVRPPGSKGAVRWNRWRDPRMVFRERKAPQRRRDPDLESVHGETRLAR